MVQREAGERMAAVAGEERYGAVSVEDRLLRPGRGGRPGAGLGVHPPPEVESVLVRLNRLATPAVDPDLVPYERLVAVVRAGFAQRRKMLRRSLAGVVAPEAFDRAGVRPEARGRGAGCGGMGPAGRTVTPRAPFLSRLYPRPRAMLAPAKLTVSLQVTGVRADGTTNWRPRW